MHLQYSSFLRWVSEKTQGRIPQIFQEPLDPDTLTILASSLYFNGRWNEHFYTGKTKKWVPSKNLTVMMRKNSLISTKLKTSEHWKLMKYVHIYELRHYLRPLYYIRGRISLNQRPASLSKFLVYSAGNMEIFTCCFKQIYSQIPNIWRTMQASALNPYCQTIKLSSNTIQRFH